MRTELVSRPTREQVAANAEELVTLAGLILLACGLWQVWWPLALMACGVVLLWFGLPSRRPFIVKPESRQKDR